MAKPDLELLRDILGDDKTHMTLAVVKKVEATGTVARVQVLTLPEELEVIATVTWDACSQGGGVFVLPAPKDLVMVSYTTEDREAWVIRRLSSSEDTIPKQAQDGHLVALAPPGKKAYLASDTAVLVGKGGMSDPTEPLVLGNVLASCLNALITQLEALLDKLTSGPLVICGSPGTPGTTYPALAADLATIKAQIDSAKTQYLSTSSSSILSQTAFTER